MKKLLLATGLFVMFSTSVMANFFVPPMNFFVNRDVATARVFNTTPFPMTCSGNAFGRTWSGVVLNTWVNQLTVYPGQWVDVTVFSNYYDPFATAWANIQCYRSW